MEPFTEPGTQAATTPPGGVARADAQAEVNVARWCAEEAPASTCTAFPPLAVFVDDEPHVLSTMARLLRGEPLRARFFDSPFAALDHLRAEPPSVIVSDYRMPRMDGVEFLERAAALHPAAARVMLTGHADVKIAAAAINRGAISRFLTKPWDADELAGVVRDLAAGALCERLLAGLPSFQASLLGMAEPGACTAHLAAWLRAVAGLGAAAEPSAAESAAAVDPCAVPLGGEHLRLFRSPVLRDRLAGLLAVAARTAAVVSEARRAEQRLHELSVTDVLSGVGNRRALDEGLSREIDRAERQGSPLALVLIDLDHFKAVNDTLGHAAGDSIIEHVGAVLRGATRSTDLAARYGGDEFCLVTPGLDAAGASRVAGRIAAAAAALAIPGHPRLALTLSIGVAQWEPGTSGDELAARADKAV